MSTYNVQEISKLLHVNEETVRRWIRKGDLKAEQSSKKKGNIVNDYELYRFINDKPKYKAMIAKENKKHVEPPLNEIVNLLLTQRNLLDELILTLQSMTNEEAQ